MLTPLLILASVFAASVPMISFLGLYWFLDRYEREPVWLVGVTFLWGALVATSISLLGNSTFELVSAAFVSAQMSTILGTVVAAPLVEELSKGAILLLVLRSRHLDNTTDGFVYGAASGLGFGMTENFLYFSLAAAGSAVDPLGGLTIWFKTVVARTLFSGLLHATASSCLGACLAKAKFASWPVRVGAGIAGLVVAFGLHALWNGLLTAGSLHQAGAMLVMADFLLFPIQFVTVLTIFRTCVAAEGTLIRSELSAEAEEHGTLPAAHAEVIAHTNKRLSHPFTPCSTRQRAYIRATTTLAFRRKQARATAGKPRGDWYIGELALLRREIRAMLSTGPTLD